MKEIKKGWGLEQIIINENEYCAKLMRVHPGKYCSLHFHKNKKETFYIIVGELELELINTTTAASIIKIVKPQDVITVETLTPHRFTAKGDRDCVFMEISMHDDPEDSYRVQPGDSQK